MMNIPKRLSRITQSVIDSIQEAPFSFYIGLMAIIIIGTSMAIIFDPDEPPVVNALSISMPLAPVLDKQEVVSETLNDAYEENEVAAETVSSEIPPSNEYDQITDVELVPELQSHAN